TPPVRKTAEQPPTMRSRVVVKTRIHHFFPMLFRHNFHINWNFFVCKQLPPFGSPKKTPYLYLYTAEEIPLCRTIKPMRCEIRMGFAVIPSYPPTPHFSSAHRSMKTGSIKNCM